MIIWYKQNTDLFHATEKTGEVCVITIFLPSRVQALTVISRDDVTSW